MAGRAWVAEPMGLRGRASESALLDDVEVSPQKRPMETRVRLDRERTSITLSSDSLDLSQLLDLTRALRQVA
jgi:hypothetical protein